MVKPPLHLCSKSISLSYSRTFLLWVYILSLFIPLYWIIPANRKTWYNSSYLKKKEKLFSTLLSFPCTAWFLCPPLQTNVLCELSKLLLIVSPSNFCQTPHKLLSPTLHSNFSCQGLVKITLILPPGHTWRRRRHSSAWSCSGICSVYTLAPAAVVKGRLG